MPYLGDVADFGACFNGGFGALAAGKGAHGEDHARGAKTNAVTCCFETKTCVRASHYDRFACEGGGDNRERLALGADEVKEGCHLSRLRGRF